ncbi:hypothetical protein [Azohydromonas aeria]|uniref:hypothetical protein n=1 Tax=Azohydromonas aeria TaxID=2590212 RepID=UPI0018DF9E69|nr:hypothetical protein [Azohydromonas aeria]
MRNISFALTTPQLLAGTKTVTRRIGWQHLQAGEQLRPVAKCIGLKRGEKVQPLRAPLLVVSVRQEQLRALQDDVDYGLAECALEGFGDHATLRWPSEFVRFFCDSHKGCTPETVVTRIEFMFTDGATA